MVPYKIHYRIVTLILYCSIMFCSSADGEFLPPMVVYKGVYVQEEWKQGGPIGCQYTETKSGWFDRISFEDWFLRVSIHYT